MSTRANILLLETGYRLWIYHHWDGYPSWLGEQLMKILQKHKEHKYLDIYELANELIKNPDDEGYEITNQRHGDIEYLYVINVENKTIDCIATEFGSQCDDKLLFSGKYDTDAEIEKWFNFCKKN